MVNEQGRLAVKANESYKNFATQLGSRHKDVRRDFGKRAKDPVVSPSELVANDQEG